VSRGVRLSEELDKSVKNGLEELEKTGDKGNMRFEK
jgi:hypothetical protein